MMTSSLEDSIVAITYVSLTFFIIPIYFVLLYIFLTDKEFKKISSYKFLLNLGIFDCLQLCFHWTAGILVMYPELCDYTYFCKFLGGTLNSAWVGLFPATVTIAAQRLLIITRRNSSMNLSILLKGMLLIGWIYTLLFYLGLLTIGTVTFSPESYSWGYADDEFSSLMENVEYFVSLLSIIISFIIYILVIGEILYLNTFSSMSSTRTNRQESWILIQSTILFVNLALLLSAWHHYDLFLPEAKETFFIINSYWIVYCGLNPLLYLTINKTIRQKFIEVFCNVTKPINTTIIQTNTTPSRNG